MTNEEILYLLDKIGIETENMIKLTKRSKHEQEIYNNEHSKRCNSFSSSKNYWKAMQKARVIFGDSRVKVWEDGLSSQLS